MQWGLPQAVSPETVQPWGKDTVAPIMPLNEAYYLFSREGNQWPAYPLFHFIVLNAAYSPYMVYSFLSGEFGNLQNEFPYGINNIEAFCRDLTIIARIVSLFMALGIVAASFKICEEIFNSRAATWSAILIIFFAPLAYYAKSANLDVPHLFWTFLGVLQYIRVLKFHRLRNYVFLGIFVALATATKDQAFGFFIFAPIAIIISKTFHANDGTINIRTAFESLISKEVLTAFIVCLFTFSLANNLLFGGWNGFIRHVKFPLEWFSQAHAQNPEAHTMVNHLIILKRTYQLLVESFGYGSFIVCLGGIILAICKKHWMSISIFILPIGFYISIIFVFEGVTLRHLIGTAIIFFILGGSFIEYILAKKTPIRIIAAIFLMFSLSWQIALTANLNLILLKDSRYEAERFIRENIPAGTVIESHILEKFLPRISKDYSISVKGWNDKNELVPEELKENALSERNPDYIIVLKELGISGDPETESNHDVKNFYKSLFDGMLGYRVLKAFKTPHFISHPHIKGTRPTVYIFSKSSA
jgi:hypothetical protein